MRSILILFVTAAILAACTHPANILQEKGSSDCSDPPAGVIRFALRWSDNMAVRYEWSGTSYHNIGSEQTGKGLIQQVGDGGIHQRDYWGDEVRNISRDAAGPGTILSTPYAMNRDRSILAAAIISSEHKYDPPHRIALLQLKNIPAAVNIIELGEFVESLAWNPQGDAVVILSRREKYVRRTLRERFASAIGHPIPYSDITLITIGKDGKKGCSITPARELAYGRGHVRWDDQ